MGDKVDVLTRIEEHIANRGCLFVDFEWVP
jgi:hypothetical protein